MKRFIHPIAFIAVVIMMAGCAGSRKVSQGTVPTVPPSDPPKVDLPNETPVEVSPEEPLTEEMPPFVTPEREMRGVWIATVANIDWPNAGTDSFEKQQEDFLQILDFYHQRNFNAVFVQIRAAGDAFYPTNLAPWSKFLTGKEGKAPATKMDPLKWMIQAAHERGMEFHAWLNPYRATFNLKIDELSPEHDYYRHPDWMVKYGSKFYYDPGLPEVQDHLTKIVREVVKNYQIDGVHFDDYFYPYKIPEVDFGDQKTYQRYGRGQSIDDWRRSNVDALIKKVSSAIRAEKPWLQFGVSPFGVWRNASADPQGSDTRAGQTNYDDLYANPLVWMENGWVDYIVPQIYWSMDFPVASYKKLVNWWSSKSNGTLIYIGNGPYKIRNDADGAWNNVFEIPNQVALSKSINAVHGNIFFRARSLMGNNRDVANLLLQNNYSVPALPPCQEVSSGILQKMQPDIQSAHLSSKGLQISISNAYLAKSVVLYGYNANGKWELVQSQFTSVSIDGETFVFDGPGLQNFPYLAVGFLGNYGEASQIKVWRP